CQGPAGARSCRLPGRGRRLLWFARLRRGPHRLHGEAQAGVSRALAGLRPTARGCGLLQSSMFLDLRRKGRLREVERTETPDTRIDVNDPERTFSTCDNEIARYGLNVQDAGNYVRVATRSSIEYRPDPITANARS